MQLNKNSGHNFDIDFAQEEFAKFPAYGCAVNRMIDISLQFLRILENGFLSAENLSLRETQL